MSGGIGKVRLRVHFVPVGFEVDRAVEPLKALRADAAILITFSRTDRVSASLKAIVERLEKSRIPSHVVECNVWDVAVVATEVGSIVAGARHHEYFFNVSTGPKTACIAGTIAGMFWPIKLYYAPVDYSAKTRLNKQDYPFRPPVSFIPTFETPPLDRTVVTTLEHIVEAGPISKGALISRLKSLGAIGPRQRPSVTPQALHAQTDAILRRLDSWGFVEIEGRGKAMRVRATEMGRAGAKMFHHVLYPRPPPELLSE